MWVSMKKSRKKLWEDSSWSSLFDSGHSSLEDFVVAAMVHHANIPPNVIAALQQFTPFFTWIYPNYSSQSSREPHLEGEEGRETPS